MANREKKKNLTRKQHSRLEKERTQRKLILIGTIIVIAVVIITVVVGVVTEEIIKPRQPVAEVGDTSITTGEFQAFTRYQRFQLVNEYLGTYQYVSQMSDPNTASYFESYLLQIQSQLNPEILGLNVINQMVEDVIIKKEAERLGIEVAKQEVEQKIQESIFQYYPNGTPTPGPTRPVYPTPTLSYLQLTLVPPTPTIVISETMTETSGSDEAVDNGELADNESDATTPTLMPTEILPTSTAYTEKAYTQNYDQYFSYLRSYARLDEKEIYDYFEMVILREKVAEAVITDLPKEEEKLWARHILFQDTDTGKEQAEEFLKRIKAGEDFVTVAEELSANPPKDEEVGGTIIFEDLGWFGEGSMVETFEAAAKALEVGEISDPVQTSFGWHVIQLLGRDVQPRSQTSLDQLREQEFQIWITKKRAEYEINISPDWISLVPEEPDIPEQAKIPTDQQTGQ